MAANSNEPKFYCPTKFEDDVGIQVCSSCCDGIACNYSCSGHSKIELKLMRLKFIASYKKPNSADHLEHNGMSVLMTDYLMFVYGAESSHFNQAQQIASLCISGEDVAAYYASFARSA